MGKTEIAGDILIRRIKRTEFDQAFKLISEAFQREIEIAGLDVRRLNRMTRLYSVVSGFLFLFDILHIDLETVLVAVSENKLVGEIHLMPCGKKIWSINSVAVDSQFRRRGIYRHLMQEALKYVVRRHGRRIVQSVRKDNVAPVKVANELKFQVFVEKTLMYLEICESPPVDIKNDILIRKVRPADAQRIYEMCRMLDPKRVDIYEIKPEDYLDSLSSRLRKKITQIYSERFILSSKGKVVGYASVTYTSQREAAKLDSFYLLPSRNHSELVNVFLRHIVNLLRTRNIRKVIVDLNSDWLEIIEAFHCFGFENLAFGYEMVKELVDGEQYEH